MPPCASRLGYRPRQAWVLARKARETPNCSSRAAALTTTIMVPMAQAAAVLPASSVFTAAIDSSLVLLA